MNDPIVITRALVKRGWTDFEPKVITGLLTGTLAAFLASVLSMYGIHLSTLQQNILVVAFYFIGSYLTPSSGTTITKTVQDAADNIIKEVESHRGPVVSTISTGPIPIQVQPAFTEVLHGGTPEQRTEVMPSAGEAFLKARGLSDN